jgi:ABC-2 type transport system permease protein
MSAETPNPNLDFVLSDPSIPTASAPIADLSYRNYDGPLHTRAARWWIIAVSRMRYLRGRWWFWLFIALSLLPYLITMVIMYVQSQAPAGARGMFTDNTVGQKYAAHFVQTLGWQSFWIFIIAIAVGAGSIAADNRSNALLVYLSKPLTKGDYLLGKWMGIFMTVFLSSFVPALIFYIYCLLSYTSDGFLRDEPWLIVRLIAACAVPGVIHASLLVGFSAWSKTPLVAGAVYAGLYLCSSAVSLILWMVQSQGDPEKGLIVGHLSVSGIINGLTQNVFHLTYHLTGFRRKTGEFRQIVIPPPNVWIMLAIALGLIVIGVGAARARIRAVEVVRG